MKNKFISLILTITVTLVFSCKDKQTEKNMQNINIDSLIESMTLEEKINLIHASSSFTSGGAEKHGIPEIVMSDGPHGVRHEHGRDWDADNTSEDSSTYLPTGVVLASTWNRELGYEYGTVLGSEANHRGKNIILGPGINIIRSPLNGRNFEYMSEDPYLASEMCIKYINGVQDQGVGACAKHFAVNNQETNRDSINTIVSERALQEIYYPAFKAAAGEAKVASIMSAYNKLNGKFCSSSEYLLDSILRGQFGFKGIVISDWNAVHETKSTLLCGLDIEMGTDLGMLPNPEYNKFYLADAAIELIKSGEVKEEFVDIKLRRILNTMIRFNMFEKNNDGKRNTTEHHQLALKVAEEGIVLLKNKNILPVKDNVKTIAVIGDNATAVHAHKGGSSQVKSLYEITPLEGIKDFAGEKFIITYAKGYEVNEENKFNKELYDQALETAKNADLVIFVGGWIHSFDNNQWGEGCFDAEASDKQNIDLLFGQDKLIEGLASVNKNLVTVIYGGSSVKFGKWSDNSKAILHAWYPGMEGGNALANIIFGKTNPSGKLPVSFAYDYTDYPSHAIGEFPGNGFSVEYKEDIYVGYRYFDTFKKDVAYPFGHGLSYTTFEYGKINIEKTRFSKDEIIRFKVAISNTGNYEGAEILQVYVSDLDSEVERPVKELKAFDKVFLKIGEKKEVEFSLDKTAFSYYHPEKKEWVLEPGEFEIIIGASVKDIRQKVKIEIN